MSARTQLFWAAPSPQNDTFQPSDKPAQCSHASISKNTSTHTPRPIPKFPPSPTPKQSTFPTPNPSCTTVEEATHRSGMCEQNGGIPYVDMDIQEKELENNLVKNCGDKREENHTTEELHALENSRSARLNQEGVKPTTKVSNKLVQGSAVRHLDRNLTEKECRGAGNQSDIIQEWVHHKTEGGGREENSAEVSDEESSDEVYSTAESSSDEEFEESFEEIPHRPKVKQFYILG